MSIFKDILNKYNKMAVAIDGDMMFGNLTYIADGTGILSQGGVEILYGGVYKGKPIYIGKYKPNTSLILLLENYIEPQTSKSGETYDFKLRYYVIGALRVKYLTSWSKLNYRLVREIQGIEIHKDRRNQGYAKYFYKTLVDELGWNLLGDLTDYENSRRLWVSLSKDPDYQVDIVDSSTGIIFEKKVILKDILDDRVWVKYEDVINKRLNQEQDRVGRFHRLILTNVR